MKNNVFLRKLPFLEKQVLLLRNHFWSPPPCLFLPSYPSPLFGSHSDTNCQFGNMVSMWQPIWQRHLLSWQTDAIHFLWNDEIWYIFRLSSHGERSTGLRPLFFLSWSCNLRVFLHLNSWVGHVAMNENVANPAYPQRGFANIELVGSEFNRKL